MNEGFHIEQIGIAASTGEDEKQIMDSVDNAQRIAEGVNIKQITGASFKSEVEIMKTRNRCQPGGERFESIHVAGTER